MIPIIISASRRTDIPAFYSDWFINRIQAGYFIKVNPYNPQQRKRVSLLPPDVDVIVFWSKNPLPLIKHLKILDQLGVRYLFHYTLNSYPKILEPRIPDLTTRINIFKQLSDQIGPSKVIWRYDPIIISNLTPVEYHLEQFVNVAKELQGYTERVVISFLTLYNKVGMKLKRLAQECLLKIADIRSEEQREKLTSLAANLSLAARQYGLEIYTCSEKLNLQPYNIRPGSCIDLDLINRVCHLKMNFKKDKYQRLECRCAESVDMGFYDTCNFGCSYCYANVSDQAVQNKVSKHNPQSPILVG